MNGVELIITANGKPGSGKTTALAHLIKFLTDSGWKVTRNNPEKHIIKLQRPQIVNLGPVDNVTQTKP